MTRVLQISDPHFGTERPEVVEALTRLAREQTPELVILSGDITQRARRSQFKAAREFVDKLQAPHVIAIPGNHDIPLFNLLARCFYPYANHCREFGPELEPSYESERLLVLAVKTTRRYRHKDGEISPQQVERIAQRLAGASGSQLRIVVTHQPVAVIRPEDECNLLHGHARAARRWTQAGADLILGGHIHLPYLLALHERDPSLPRKAWVMQAGTAVSWRIRYEADNSVNLIHYRHSADEPCARVERWDYTEAQLSFKPVDAQELFLTRA